MKLEERIALVEEVGEEIVTGEGLHALLAEKKHPVAYDGFEPSGQVHIAQGLLRAVNVNKMLKAGCKFYMLAADWHAWANNKLGGNLARIHTAGDYLVEIWKACGMETGKVKFLRSSDLVSKGSYWKTVMRVARSSTVKRLMRCSQIMGRGEGEALSGSQILYPCMQAADIFELKADITQLGMDQRKVNMLAREMGERLGFWKPVVVSHHMLMGLQQPKGNARGVEREIEMKMSKSVPNSAIFMTDSREEVERKLQKAYCPAKEVRENPVLDYCRHIVFEREKKMKVERSERFGGDVEFASFGELAEAFKAGALHPADLKRGTAMHLNRLLEPVRKHFSKGKTESLLESVKGMRATR